MTTEIKLAYSSSKPINITSSPSSNLHLMNGHSNGSLSPNGNKNTAASSSKKMKLKCLKNLKSSSSSQVKLNQQQNYSSIHISSNNQNQYNINNNGSTINCVVCQSKILQPMFYKETPKEKLSFCSMNCFASNH